MRPKLLILLSLTLAVNAEAGSATWKLNSASGDWNTAANWTPATVPNGGADTATFDVSNTTDVSLSSDVEINSIMLNPGASAYRIKSEGSSLTVSGAGIINDSGVTQELMLGDAGGMIFLNSATAGTGTLYTLSGSVAQFSSGSAVNFFGESSAGEGTFVLGGGHGSDTVGGRVVFDGDVSAENATIICEPSEPATGTIAFVGFYSGRAGNATIIANGSNLSKGLGGDGFFSGDAKAENATLIANGTTGGSAAGSVGFTDASEGESARVELFGTGFLTIASHDLPGLTIGSLEGDGLVFLGSNNLTVGSNNLSSTFRGTIQETGSLSKTGAGTLALSGTNTYIGGTTVEDGGLLAKNNGGSATGTGAVQVLGGTLGGDGIIAGPVTVGTGNGAGAFLSPAKGTHEPVTLTLQSSLTFKADSTYNYKLSTRRAKADRVIANGVAIESGAQFNLHAVAHAHLHIGQVFTAISNTSTSSIVGAFSNLADGAIVNVNGNNLQASYSGGDGNDLTLTVVP